MQSKGKILVVDDDRLVLATVVHGLAEAGYEVVDADNGDDAILLARRHRPELALLDIRMEGKTGFDVAAYLRTVPIPFMFLSAFSDPATIAEVEALGAVAYMVKPLDVGQIVPTVDDALRRLRSGKAPVAAAAAPADDGSTVLGQSLALAVGALMHRHSLGRRDALARLERMAGEKGLTPLAQAERLLAAIEELARSD